MAADARIGTDGPYRLGLNEVRIGLTLPWFAVVLARHRLSPAHFDHAAVTGDMFDPQSAREAGLLDTVVSRAVISTVARRASPRTSAQSTVSTRRHQIALRLPVLQRTPGRPLRPTELTRIPASRNWTLGPVRPMIKVWNLRRSWKR